MTREKALQLVLAASSSKRFCSQLIEASEIVTHIFDEGQQVYVAHLEAPFSVLSYHLSLYEREGYGYFHYWIYTLKKVYGDTQLLMSEKFLYQYERTNDTNN